MKIGNFRTSCINVWRRYRIALTSLAALGGVTAVPAGIVHFNDDRYVRARDFTENRFEVAGAVDKINSIESQLESFQRMYTINRLVDRRSDVRNRIREIERRIEAGEATATDHDWLGDLRTEEEEINAQLRAVGVH